MRGILDYVRKQRVMLVNAGSLIGTTLVTSLLGFAFWWVAARRFVPEVVGIASAGISAMMLLGTFCVLGFGTLLITELPRQPQKAATLINTALLVVGFAGLIVGTAFALIAPALSSQFEPLRADLWAVLIFASGVSLTALTLVLDQALIGLLQGEVQLWRNILFSVAKLAALFGISFVASLATGISVYGTWALGNLISVLAVLAFFLLRTRGVGAHWLPRWQLLKSLGGAAVLHHLLNMTLVLPTQVLPVMVTAMLSARMNAWFYVSWMLANFIFLIPYALSTVLHAMNAAEPHNLAQKSRMTLAIGTGTCLVCVAVLYTLAPQVLGFFGRVYAENSTLTLRLLLLAVFPQIIKNHYIAVCRIQDRIAKAMLGMLPGGILELGAAALGAYLNGLDGLCLGWALAMSVEALCMLPTVYQSTRPNKEVLLQQQRDLLSEQDTQILEAISARS